MALKVPKEALWMGLRLSLTILIKITNFKETAGLWKLGYFSVMKYIAFIILTRSVFVYDSDHANFHHWSAQVQINWSKSLIERENICYVNKMDITNATESFIKNLLFQFFSPKVSKKKWSGQVTHNNQETTVKPISQSETMKSQSLNLLVLVLLPASSLAVIAINGTERFPVCIDDSDCEKRNLDGHACFQYFCYPWEPKATEASEPERPLATCRHAYWDPY